ncbi:MAG: FadD3 family acyl-CoA ligase [Ilumatobacteraceae bacterium]|nr:FadD3 family acyl-CoA ligase [Ilumatobacteraceae bacterium]
MRPDLEFGTVGRMVRAARIRFGDLEAVVDDAQRWTFAHLADRIDEAAGAAVSAGIERGDSVAIWAPNSREWIVSALGCVSIGASLVPVNTRFRGAEAAEIIDRSGARLLFTVTGFLGNDYVAELRGAGRELDRLERIVVMNGHAPSGTSTWSDFLAESSSVSTRLLDERMESVEPDDVSDVLFTSGTTGRPKGVMTTHAQNLRVFQAWADTVGLERGDRYLMVNPYFHSFGYKAGILACMLQGATMFPEPVFDVERVFERIESESITVLPGAPTIHLSMLDHPDRDVHRLSSLRLAVTGAANIPVELIRRMRSEMSYDTVVSAYGLTEATGTVSICRPDDDAETIATTSGRAIPDTEVSVVDEAGREVPRGEPGEVVCRGYHVMIGYLDDPEATAQAIDENGWLHTGDIGTMDDRGYLSITDRKKDMFIVGGFNVYPAEVENGLLAHPDIANAAVVGVPDRRLGEVGNAYVVPRAGALLEATELTEWCRTRMANFKVPRAFHVVESLPTNASGKVLKYELRAVASGASG